MISKIKKLGSYWLVNEIDSQFIIKEEERSPKYNSRIQVVIFNKTDGDITLNKNSAVAEIVTKLFPYSHSTFPKYTLLVYPMK